MTAKRVFRVLARAGLLMGALLEILPVAIWQKGWARRVFERELRRMGVPRPASRVLSSAYGSLVPLTPSGYIRVNPGRPLRTRN